MIQDCVIIGGGVAGLSAANRLVDRGVKPIVIDAGRYPAHRICGEFFSYEGLPILQEWKLSPVFSITDAMFFSGEQHFSFPLPEASGSCSRYEFDTRLLERARQKGAHVFTETSVVDLRQPSGRRENYEVVLSNGKRIEARHLFIGTGRIANVNGGKEKPFIPKYFGFKAHFEGIIPDSAIRMYAFPGGYAGMSSIDDQRTNVACIVQRDFVKNKEHPEDFLRSMEEQASMAFFNKNKNPGKMIFSKWLIGQVPEFGIRDNPNWERVFWIGDAAGSIPPISGDGLAIAITSGCMAADYFLESTAQDFQKDWQKRYRRRFTIAKQLHRIMCTPWLTKIAFAGCRLIPSIPAYFWKLTRE